MRFALILIPAMLSAAELNIDHVTAGGADIKTMQARLASIGLPSEYGGPHSNHATEMAITSFPDGSYLELIAIQPHADAKALKAHYWHKFIEGNAGPCAWAVRSADLAAETKRLKAAGVTVGETQRSGRQKPDGTKLEWETVNTGTGPNGAFFPFVIRDFTPRPNRAFVAGHPTTTAYHGVTRVVIAVSDLKEGIARFRAAYGLPQPLEVTDPALGARLAIFEGSPVVVAASVKPGLISDRIEKFGEGPCAFVIGKSGPQPGWHVKWFDSAKLGWYLGAE
jgi:hypothetical protein